MEIKQVFEQSKALTDQIEKLANKNQPVPDKLLDSLKVLYKGIIELEKYQLITVQDKFWGNVLAGLDVVVDFSVRRGVNLNISTEPFRLEINPLFCKNWVFQEFTGAITDELLKLVCDHPSSYSHLNSGRDTAKHELLEKASSAASTSLLKKDIRLDSSKNVLKVPKDYYTTSDVNLESNKRAAEGETLEYYYKLLNKPNQNGGNQPSGNGIATMDNGEGVAGHDWENQDESETRQKTISLVQSAWNATDDDSRGYLPASIQEKIKMLLAPPELDWKDYFKRLLGSIPVPYRKTRNRLNRRQPLRGDLCGRLPDRTVNVVIAIDTSGSMSDNMIRYVLKESYNIASVYAGFKITVIECDAEIGRIYEIHNEYDLAEAAAKGVTGRGGTSFIPVIEYINGSKKYEKKYPATGCYQDAVLIYFTDGYGDYEIPQPRTYRNLWVVFGSESNLSLKEPYGEVKSLKGDKTFRDEFM